MNLALASFGQDVEKEYQLLPSGDGSCQRFCNLCEELGNGGGFLGNSLALTDWGSNQSSDGWSVLESLTTSVLMRVAVVGCAEGRQYAEDVV